MPWNTHRKRSDIVVPLSHSDNCLAPLLQSPKFIKSPLCGEVPEWSNGAVSKTVEPSRAPRVRIPVSPPRHSKSMT